MPEYFSNISELSIHQLLEQKIPLEAPRNRYHCFAVPDFQRRYAWDKTNWEKFWEDAELHMTNKDDWFLGSMITLSGRNSSNSGPHLHDVIDGQQRLTTIFIFRVVVYSFLNKLVDVSDQSKRKIVDQYKEIIQNVAGNDRLVHANDYVTASPNKTRLMQLFDYYVGNSTNVPDKRTQYYKACEFFKSKFVTILKDKNPNEKVDILLDYYETIDSARLIWAQVADLTQAMSMFEVLNNRGKPLGVTDIVKTTILRRWITLVVENASASSADSARLEGIHRTTIEQSGVLWQNVQKRIYAESENQSTHHEKYDDATTKRFIRHFYILQAPKVDTSIPYANLTEKEMLIKFDELMKKIATLSQMDVLRAKMLQYAAYYGFMRNPMKWDWAIDDGPGLMRFIRSRSTTHTEYYIAHLLSDIHTLGLVQINLLLLYALDITYSDLPSETEYKNRINALYALVCTILRFVIRRNLTDIPRPNEMDTILADLLKSVVPSGKSVVEKLGEMNEYVFSQASASTSTLSHQISNLRFDNNLNSEIRFLLHFVEKWKVSVSESTGKNALVLEQRDNPFDGFKLLDRKNSPWYQIEHIMPQSLLKEKYEGSDDDEEVSSPPSSNAERWITDLNRWNSSFTQKTEDERAALIHSLGNLTFLDHNGKLSDRVFAEKQHHLGAKKEQVGYKALIPDVLNNLLVSADGSLTLRTTPCWTEREIEVRTRAMNERLLQLLALGGSDQKE